jgi:hypothetical protein
LLLKLAIFKSNCVMDCLLFSIFKKVSQLTPSIFGALVGPYDAKIKELILSKFRVNSASFDGQIATIMCEFLCSLIENQSGFFQQMAGVSLTSENKFVETDSSVLKAMFSLLSSLKPQKGDQSIGREDFYYVSLAGVYSIFYTIWLGKKVDYMNYCKQKSEFWPSLATTLKLIRKKWDVLVSKNKSFLVSNQPNNYQECQEYFNANGQHIMFASLSYDIKKEYLDYFGFKSEEQDPALLDDAEFERFYEFIIEANVNSASRAFKIYAIELYDLVRFK